MHGPRSFGFGKSNPTARSGYFRRFTDDNRVPVLYGQRKQSAGLPLHESEPHLVHVGLALEIRSNRKDARLCIVIQAHSCLIGLRLSEPKQLVPSNEVVLTPAT